MALAPCNTGVCLRERVGNSRSRIQHFSYSLVATPLGTGPIPLCDGGKEWPQKKPPLLPARAFAKEAT